MRLTRPFPFLDQKESHKKDCQAEAHKNSQRKRNHKVCVRGLSTAAVALPKLPACVCILA